MEKSGIAVRDELEEHVKSTERLPSLASARHSLREPDAASIHTQATAFTTQTDQGSVQTRRRSADTFSRRSRLDDEDAEFYASQLYLFTQALESEPYDLSEPWHLEMRTLRRITFININNKLAACRKRLYDTSQCTEDDAEEIRVLLHQQAEAIRDYEYIRSLEKLSHPEQKRRHEQSNMYFKDQPESSAFWRLQVPVRKDPWNDEVRRILLNIIPKSWSYTAKEKQQDWELYDQGHPPSHPRDAVERVARFIVAMTGALYILIPMYIMALHQSRTSSLVTTTVAVLLFAVTCSVMLRTSNDQTLAATFGYAAVLMVFVGLTIQYQQ